jgi:hypothetical protein
VVALARHRSRRALITQPIVVVTNWGAHGAALFATLLLAAAAGGVAYRNALLRADAFSLPGLIAIAALALAAAWCAPVLFSSDVYAYAAYGELARIGLNPYAHAAIAKSDALIGDAAWQWGGLFPICVYGPLFVALASLVVAGLAPLGTLAQLQGLRAMASAAFLLCIPLAAAAFSGGRSTRMRAAATIGLNPVAIWCAAEGHNDALALAIVLAGFALMQRRLRGTGAAIVGLSALIKLPGALAAIALAIVDRRARIGAAAGVLVSALLSAPLITAVATQLAPHGQYAPQASLQAVVAPFGQILALLVALGAAAVLAARGVALVRRRQEEGWIWLGLAAWACIPNPYPWYGIWLIALAALAPATRASVVAILLSFTSLLRYAPDAIATPSSAASVALGVLATLPFVGLIPTRSWYNERLA